MPVVQPMPDAPPPADVPVPAPYAVRVPDDARPLGTPPFLAPGEVVMWRYRDLAWAPGLPETVSPMRVVRDDERGLVAWLAPGTPQLTKRYPDGSGLRDVPLADRFVRDPQRVQARSRWQGAGILRVAPAGRPWSVWLFWDVPDGLDPAEPAHHDAWQFAGWYVSLETAHHRAGSDTFTGDHVLDLWIDAHGTVHVKDADELEASEQVGRLGADATAAIRLNAEHGRASFHAGDWPFDDAWTRWRPDAAWSRPTCGPTSGGRSTCSTPDAGGAWGASSRTRPPRGPQVARTGTCPAAGCADGVHACAPAEVRRYDSAPRASSSTTC